MKHSEKVYIVKQAFGLASPIGALYGLGKAPEGEKGEGLIHGLIRGIGVDAGTTLGGIPGMLLDEALTTAQNRTGGRIEPDSLRKATPMGRKLRKGAGPLLTALGILGGGYGGHHVMDKFMGKAPYDEEK